MVEYWTEKGPHECQNLNGDFSLTKREYHKQNRYLKKSYFESMQPNKQIGKREWLVYSPKTKKVYCFYCLLFCDYGKRGLLCEGFNDWKKMSYIAKHPQIEQHTVSLGTYHSRKKLKGRIDVEIEKQFLENRSYWKSVLQHIIATTALFAR